MPRSPVAAGAIRRASVPTTAPWDCTTMLWAVCLAVLLGYGECGRRGGDGGDGTPASAVAPGLGVQAVAEVPLPGVVQPTDAVSRPSRRCWAPGW